MVENACHPIWPRPIGALPAAAGCAGAGVGGASGACAPPLSPPPTPAPNYFFCVRRGGVQNCPPRRGAKNVMQNVTWGLLQAGMTFSMLSKESA